MAFRARRRSSFSSSSSDTSDSDDEFGDDNKPISPTKNVGDACLPAPKSVLGRCPNCNAYGVFKAISTGSECLQCCWFQPSSRLPAVVSPRVDAAQRGLEQKINKCSAKT